MKKSVFWGMVIILCFLIPRVQAQSAVGSKVGVNFSKFLINESAQRENTVGVGVSLGNFYRYAVYENVAVEADMMFHYQTSEIKDLTTGQTTDYRYFGMEIPVYGIMQADLERSMLYLGLGPFASVGLISRYKMDINSIDPYKKDMGSDKAMMHRWDFGVGFVVGYELEFGLQFNLNYHLGLRDLLDADSDKATMTSQLIGLGLGYRF